MKTIYLRSSELAKLTGHNTYEPLEKTIQTILSFNQIQDVYVPKTNIEKGLLDVNPDDLVKIKKELLLPPTATIHQVEKVIQRTILNQSSSSSLLEQESRDKLASSLQKKKTLQKIQPWIQQDLQIKRGIQKEKDNLNSMEKKRNWSITHRNSKLYKKELYRHPQDTYCVVLKGKVDGLCENRIIETKNRTRCLFKTLRDYERVQLESYMYLTGIDEATLTEHYNEDSFEIDYTHDPNFWEQCLLKIIEFIDEHIAIHL